MRDRDINYSLNIVFYIIGWYKLSSDYLLSECDN